MRLPKTGREYYALKIVTEPVVGPWEASFDRGITWHPATMDDDYHTWLVNGPEFDDDGTPSITVTNGLLPILRLIDQPEVLIRNGTRFSII